LASLKKKINRPSRTCTLLLSREWYPSTVKMC
jgi:hypothetical protein